MYLREKLTEMLQVNITPRIHISYVFILSAKYETMTSLFQIIFKN